MAGIGKRKIIADRQVWVESRPLAYDCQALIFFGYFTLLASIEKNGMFSRSWVALMRTCFELKKNPYQFNHQHFN